MLTIESTQRTVAVANQIPESESETGVSEVFLLEFVCGNCGTELVTGSQFAGVEASCPNCWRPTRAPGAHQVSSSPASASASAAEAEGGGGEWSRDLLVPVGSDLDLEGVPKRDGFQARHRIPDDPLAREPDRRGESIRREARRRKKRRELDQAIGNVLGTGRFRRWRRRLSAAALFGIIVGITYMAMNNWQMRPPRAGEEPGLAHRLARILIGSGASMPGDPGDSASDAGGSETAAAPGVPAERNEATGEDEGPGRSLASRPIEGSFRWGE